MTVKDFIRELSCLDQDSSITITLFNMDTDEGYCYDIEEDMIADLIDEESGISLVLYLDTEELQRSFPKLLKLNRDNVN